MPSDLRRDLRGRLCLERRSPRNPAAPGKRPVTTTSTFHVPVANSAADDSTFSPDEVPMNTREPVLHRRHDPSTIFTLMSPTPRAPQDVDKARFDQRQARLDSVDSVDRLPAFSRRLATHVPNWMSEYLGPTGCLDGGSNCPDVGRAPASDGTVDVTPGIGRAFRPERPNPAT